MCAPPQVKSLSGAQGASKARRSHPRRRASWLLHSLHVPHPLHHSRLASPVRRRRGLRRTLMPLMRGFELIEGEAKKLNIACGHVHLQGKAAMPHCSRAMRAVLPTEQAPMRQRMTPCPRAAAQQGLTPSRESPVLQACLRVHCDAVAEVGARRGRRDVRHKLREVGRQEACAHVAAVQRILPRPQLLGLRAHDIKRVMDMDLRIRVHEWHRQGNRHGCGAAGQSNNRPS